MPHVPRVDGILASAWRFTALVVEELGGDDELQNWVDGVAKSHAYGLHEDLAWWTRAFWRTESSNDLMHYYYRGFPAVISSAAERAARHLTMADDDWLLDVLDDARTAVAEVRREVVSTDLPHYLRAHRIDAVPALVAAQLLPYASSHEAKSELNHEIASRLTRATAGALGGSDSGSEQLTQMIPQIVTDQLLSGPGAWRRLVLGYDVLHALLRLGGDARTRKRQETGVAMSLQCLAYYHMSLHDSLKRERLSDREAEGIAVISRYFADLLKEPDVIGSGLAAWLKNLQSLSRSVMHAQAPYRVLPRQSSAAVIAAHQRPGEIDPRFRDLFASNNLRAGLRGYTLNQGEEMQERLAAFLVRNGLAAGDVRRIANRYLGRGSDIRAYLNLLISKFKMFTPDTPGGAAAMAAGKGMTLDEVIWRVEGYRNRAHRLRTFRRVFAADSLDGFLLRLVRRPLRPLLARLARRVGSFRLERVIGREKVRQLVDTALGGR